MKNVVSNTNKADFAKDVRERLLDAAEEFFSEKGFEGTNIRDLTAKADSNIAAVNYHFRGKENLYNEVFRRRMIAMRDVRISSINNLLAQQGFSLVLEDLLRTFSIAFIEPFKDEAQGGRFMKLMIREMLDPHLPKTIFMEELAAPTMNVFGNAILQLYPKIEQKKLILLTISLIGQLMHFMHMNEFFGSAKTEQLQIGNVNEIIEHVVKFTAAGIRNMAEGK